ncbi:hypothetical protein BU23DRAFT_552224 [Bimuria novae-zelandiae CBS 107.79]|uniref:Uncharacterized protein n=1 Tax=Bimuria novae-zelandiae CBS 107.79 TaxID=1447943 RepID=A0A6A5VR54_9PLEO|nr:hypothetical protein BU23DRAFT_552224 [Bimuria novae-zelandiae CBS 107.79]
MSTSPTYYKELNTVRFSGVIAAALFIAFVAANLSRRSQSSGLFSDAIFASSLACAEFGFYVSDYGFIRWLDTQGPS